SKSHMVIELPLIVSVWMDCKTDATCRYITFLDFVNQVEGDLISRVVVPMSADTFLLCNQNAAIVIHLNVKVRIVVLVICSRIEGGCDRRKVWIFGRFSSR